MQCALINELPESLQALKGLAHRVIYCRWFVLYLGCGKA